MFASPRTVWGPGVRYTSIIRAICRLVRSGCPDRTYPISVCIQLFKARFDTAATFQIQEVTFRGYNHADALSFRLLLNFRQKCDECSPIDRRNESSASPKPP